MNVNLFRHYCECRTGYRAYQNPEQDGKRLKPSYHQQLSATSFLSFKDEHLKLVERRLKCGAFVNLTPFRFLRQ